MTLMTRMTRLLKADVHAVLDALEEPLALLKQAVREMEDTVGRDRAVLAASRTREQSARTALEAIAQARAQLARELSMCLDAQREALARTVVRQQLELNHRTDTLTAELIQTERETAAIEARLAARQRRLEEIQTQLKRAEANANVESTGAYAESSRAAPGGPPIDDDAIELALLQAKRARGEV